MAELTNESAAAVAEMAAAPSSLSDLRPKQRLTGKVTRVELYGAFVDIGVGAPAVLHISQLGQQVNRLADALSVGEEITIWVDKVDTGRNQVIVTMIEPVAVEWGDLREGRVYIGHVTRLEPFGAFVDIGAEKEGLVHVSELSREYVKHPSEVVRVGDEIQVKLTNFDRRKHRIDLSRKALLETPAAAASTVAEANAEEEDELLPNAMEVALRRAMAQTAASRASSQSGKSARAYKEKLRARQEDILARTLNTGHEADN